MRGNGDSGNGISDKKIRVSVAVTPTEKTAAVLHN